MLQAGAATLEVTLDHRVVLPDGCTASRHEVGKRAQRRVAYFEDLDGVRRSLVQLQVPARNLRVGQEVMVQRVPTKLTSVDVQPGPVTVWAISFVPDRPVEAGPHQTCGASIQAKPF